MNRHRFSEIPGKLVAGCREVPHLDLTKWTVFQNLVMVDKNHIVLPSMNHHTSSPRSPRSTTLKPEEELELFLHNSSLKWAIYSSTGHASAKDSIGEHVYALSLAPGEEIVLEQKTFRRGNYAGRPDGAGKHFLILSYRDSEHRDPEGFERQKNLTDSWDYS